MKNKGFYIIMLIWIVFMFFDFYSTLYQGYTVGKMLEANPIANYIGLGGVFVLNIGFVVVFWYSYTKKHSPTMNYFMILVMFYMILTRWVVIQNNFAVHEEIQALNYTIQQVEAIATPEVKYATMKYVAKIMYIPMAFAFMPFLIWRIDHEGRKK